MSYPYGLLYSLKKTIPGLSIIYYIIFRYKCKWLDILPRYIARACKSSGDTILRYTHIIQKSNEWKKVRTKVWTESVYSYHNIRFDIEKFEAAYVASYSMYYPIRLPQNKGVNKTFLSYESCVSSLNFLKRHYSLFSAKIMKWKCSHSYLYFVCIDENINFEKIPIYESY
jgi:hypothetical protein